MLQSLRHGMGLRQGRIRFGIVAQKPVDVRQESGQRQAWRKLEGAERSKIASQPVDQLIKPIKFLARF